MRVTCGSRDQRDQGFFNLARPAIIMAPEVPYRPGDASDLVFEVSYDMDQLV